MKEVVNKLLSHISIMVVVAGSIPCYAGENNASEREMFMRLSEVQQCTFINGISNLSEVMCKLFKYASPEVQNNILEELGQC